MLETKQRLSNCATTIPVYSTVALWNITIQVEYFVFGSWVFESYEENRSNNPSHNLITPPYQAGDPQAAFSTLEKRASCDSDLISGRAILNNL